jgi:hypothetical protein
MRKKLAVLAGCLFIIGALVAPGAAHAAVRTSAAPALSGTCDGPFEIKQYDTGKYATSAPDHAWLWFEAASEATRFCLYNAGNDSAYWQIEDLSTGSCLSLNASDGYQIAEETCADNSWDQWEPITQVAASGGNFAYVWQNGYGTNQCLYDYKQEPAITTTCATSDHFEWFWLIAA